MTFVTNVSTICLYASFNRFERSNANEIVSICGKSMDQLLNTCVKQVMKLAWFKYTLIVVFSGEWIGVRRLMKDWVLAPWNRVPIVKGNISPKSHFCCNVLKAL